MIRALFMSAAIGGFIISGALAQSNQQQSTQGLGVDSQKFIAMQTSDQWVFSKFKGTDVVGPNDEAIGSVSDVLFDKSGKIMGMIVGVGGFLGIGQKNVAMDMSAFQVVPAGTGSSAPSASSNDPTNVKLKVAWSKDQLMQAPDFQYYNVPASTVGMGQQRPANPAVPPPSRP
jgi:sporulation protein YlmC with PRC-barrel domain